MRRPLLALALLLACNERAAAEQIGANQVLIEATLVSVSLRVRVHVEEVALQ